MTDAEQVKVLKLFQAIRTYRDVHSASYMVKLKDLETFQDARKAKKKASADALDLAIADLEGVLA